MQHNHNQSMNSHISVMMRIFDLTFANLATLKSYISCENRRSMTFALLYFKETEIQHLTLHQKPVSLTP